MDVKSLKNIIAIPSSAKGLRILVVDHDTSSLMHTASILEEQSYKVTTIELATIALSMIRERENQYDLVIAEVNMPQMDGFTFLNHILLERDIPIILMSHRSKMEMAKKALEEGACFFWQKPIRIKDLINVWQHIFHNKVKAKLQKEKYRRPEESSCERSAARKVEFINPLNNSTVNNYMEKKSSQVRINLEQKQRVIWTPQLHLKFLKAINALGDEKKAQPKALLKLMNVPNLTHRHVASHLQKHRLRVMRSSGNSETSRLKPYYGSNELQKKMDFSKSFFEFSNSSNANPTASKVQLNIESSGYFGIDKIKELLTDVKSCSSNLGINEKIDDKETFAIESNSRISSCGIGVINFQEGNYFQGLEKQDLGLNISRGQFENENNLEEYFGDVQNLEVNSGIRGKYELSCSSPLEKISMCETEIMKMLEEV
ncbi:two-component response regulator ARR14 [Nicotiana tomentosiformis]|uniref:two-component response regulator ARR14 n=1 Tax=Nicotiana tomentosiformis TaxID=4098 RepID=UPI00051AADF7|nr:two-component response regulator ARR14 [Nicotiana tomentosiformis]